MEKTKVFKSGNSQAIRLPKKFRLDEEEVFIKKSGDALIIFSKNTAWDSLLKSLTKFSDDFLSERKQPELETRDSF